MPPSTSPATTSCAASGPIVSAMWRSWCSGSISQCDWCSRPSTWGLEMRLPGRLSAAIEILAEVEARHRPVSEALKSWGINNRFAGAGDRAAIGNLVYDALRRRASHAFAMGEDTPRALVLSVAVRDWGETPEALAAAFADDSHAPAALTAEEITRLSAADPLAGAPD